MKDVRGARLVVAIVPDQPGLDDVDFFLCFLVDNARHEARQLDRVLLVLEQFQLEGLVQSLVGPVVESLAFEG